jgi:hypothetical protein
MKSNHTDPLLQALENRVFADFGRKLGQTVTVRRITVVEAGRSRYRELATPATVKIVPTGARELLKYSCRDRITPEWHAELVAPHPEIPASATLSVFGTSRQADGQSFLGDVDDASLTVRLTARLIALSFRGLSRHWKAPATA